MGAKESCSNRGARGALNIVRGMLVALMLLASAAGPVNALAQETTAESDEATTDSPGELLDLPATALLPDDLPDEGYGVLGGRSVQPEPGDDDHDYWLGDYSLILALPDPDDPAVAGQLIISYVTQYTEGTRATFRLLDEQEVASADGDLIVGTRTFADASYLARIAGATAESGLPYQRLELAFRIDSLVAMVAIEDYIGQEPAVEEIEALAEIMVDRIDAVRADEQPALSAKLLHLETGNDFRVDYDSREVPLQLDGQAVRLFADTDESFQLRAEVWAESGVVDAYQNEQFLQPDGTDDVLDQLYFSSRIYRFQTEDEAAAFVETVAAETVANSDHLSDAQVVDVSGFDGATRGISYDVLLGEGVTASGIRLLTQVDAYVVSVDAEIAGGVALKGVQRLTATQVACLEDEQRCAAMTVPDSLPNVAGELLDLPAMTIPPHDLPDDGWGIVQGTSVPPIPGEDLFLGDYTLQVSLPDASRSITSSVRQFTDVEGAADHLATLTRFDEPVHATRAFGDGAGISRLSGGNVQQLSLHFRLEQVVVAIYITDWAGQEPTVTEIEALAAIMVDRFEVVRSEQAPILGSKLLAIEPRNAWDEELKNLPFGFQDSSLSVPLHIDGRTARLIHDDDETLHHRAEFWARSGVIDVYQNEIYLTHPWGTDDPHGLLTYMSRIYRFQTEDEAAAFVETVAQETVANPRHLSNIQVIDVSGFDGTTSAISYTAPLSEIVMAVDISRWGIEIDDVTTSGIRIWTHVNTYVVSVEATFHGGVTLDGVQKLTTAQVACLEDERCPPIAVPDGLLKE